MSVDINKVILLKHSLYIDDLYNIDQLLQSAPFFNQLHNVFIRLKHTPNEWYPSTLDTFNEYLYQIARLMVDPHPEEDFNLYYRSDAKYDLKSEDYAADLIFAMIRATFTVMKNKPDHVERIFAAYDSVYNSIPNVYQPFFDEFARVYVEENEHEVFDFDFTPSYIMMPNSFYSCEEWDIVTNHFEISSIEKLLLQYCNMDKRTLLMSIQTAFQESEQHKNDLPF